MPAEAADDLRVLTADELQDRRVVEGHSSVGCAENKSLPRQSRVRSRESRPWRRTKDRLLMERCGDLTITTGNTLRESWTKTALGHVKYVVRKNATEAVTAVAAQAHRA